MGGGEVSGEGREGGPNLSPTCLKVPSAGCRRMGKLSACG